MRPGETYQLEFPIGATANVFMPGHRIRLEIASSSFPRFDRNLNVGGVNMEQTRWVVARNRVHYGPGTPSRLVLPVVGR